MNIVTTKDTVVKPILIAKVIVIVNWASVASSSTVLRISNGCHKKKKINK